MPCYRPSTAPCRAASVRRAVAIALLVGGGTLVIGAQRERVVAPLTTFASMSAPRAASWAAGAAPRAPIASVASPVLAASLPGGHITMQHGEIAIAIDAMPLAEAVQRLAAATHTRLDGADALAGVPSAATLHWQGRSASDAWHRLLGAAANYAAACDEDGCRVRVLALPARSHIAVDPVAAITPTLPERTASIPAPPAADPPGLFPSDG